MADILSNFARSDAYFSALMREVRVRTGGRCVH